MYRRFPSKGSTSFLRLPRFPWRRFPQGFQVKVPEKRFSSKGSYTVLKVPKGTSYMLPQGSQVKVPTRLPRFGYVFAVSPIFYISCFLPFARLVGGICQSCFLAVGDILLGLFFIIGSESKVRHWGPSPAGRVRLEIRWCFGVKEARVTEPASGRDRERQTDRDRQRQMDSRVYLGS